MVCVGGGLGVAPVYPQARAHKERGATVIGVLGFRTADLVFWEDKFRAVCDELILCTDDGSAGIHGLVTDGLQLAIERYPDVGEVVAIGPPVMMQACAETTRPQGVHDRRQPQPDHGRRHRHVRRLPRQGGRQGAGSPASTAPTSTATRWTSTTCARG